MKNHLIFGTLIIVSEVSHFFNWGGSAQVLAC